MSESLDRLSEIVRLAEAKTRAQRIHIEIRNASDQLHSTIERARRADQRLREVRPNRLRELEHSETQEQQLKDLVKKVAQMKPSMQVNDSPEDLIASAQREIEVKRREARAELDEVVSEADEAKRELRAAMDQYQQLRLDLDRLQPQLAAGLAEEDRLVKEAAMYFPIGQLQALAKDVDARIEQYDGLESREQYAQLKVWIGCYRRLQTCPLTEEEQATSRRIFSKLVGISKEYEPGYIEAFQINFTCDWDQFIDEAREQLSQASESARRKRDADRLPPGYAAHERMRSARESGHGVLDDLRVLLTRYNLPEEGADEFRAALNRVVAGLGESDPLLLDLVMPFRELLEPWSEFRELHRNLTHMHDSDAESNAPDHDQFEDLLSLTRGMRVLLIGGGVAEDSRRLIKRVFDFDELDWLDFDELDPAEVDSIEQRIRNREADLLLVLKSYVRTAVLERFRPLCEKFSVPILVVERGHGPAQIGDAIRRGLLKTV